MNRDDRIGPADIDLSVHPETARLDADGRLLVGGCAVADIVAEHGSPAYIVDEEALRRTVRRYVSAFRDRHPRSHVLFAAKSFPAASVIGITADEGCGTDAVAGGELRLALAAGADPARAVLNGNAKTDDDILVALRAGDGRGVRYIVIDNLDDVERIARLAAELDRDPVPVLLRVSPSLQAHTHEALATGHDASKFGIPSAQVEDAIRAIRAERLVDLRGLHAHVGSQLLDLDQFDAEAAALAEFERFGVYDLGGGLGVRYVPGDEAPTIEEYAERIVRAVHRHLGDDVELLVEPGRSMIARNVVTAYRVVTVKRGMRTHVAVDGGMGDNLEVALYGQPFAPAVIDRSGPAEIVDIVGKHCESGDYLARDVRVPRPEVGDLVVIPVTGAYCYTMSNNFNTNLRPPVLLARDGRTRVAVRRETFEDLVRREQIVSQEALLGVSA
ncbi:diaminopimelate decarboxylase [Microbacterium candidum]|uniref:Diaminopimelate decarboxylase n=1 Tax=Microbacterium candidum TaxID=3041922 RepID=A0ABT7N140_9MICO|nr:diaminopimelate decarboxylase [Microbacterium sp. ASV49]MDL9980385.1 diaminopimelate decarboxylase [Microbacterium sp. ASV49]